MDVRKAMFGGRSSTVWVGLLATLLVAKPALAGGTSSTGNIPLNDLGPGLYRGIYQGGLYPGGANSPPAAHAAAALQMAQQIVPRAGNGTPDPNGWIVFVSIGMSNTTHEFGLFERQQDVNVNRNARVIILNCAQGGQTASAIAPPNANYWTIVSQRLAALGVTPAQVQVAWFKDVNAEPPDDFPGHAQVLRNDLETDLNTLHGKFANLRLCYVSSRIYAGYSTPPSLSPEPQAYESGFSFKWLIEDQINGDPGLNSDPNAGSVMSPLLLWGPYLWADGLTPRSDGLIWDEQDLEADGVHPSPSGEQKVAAMLSAFLDAEPSAQPWWPAQPGVTLVPIDAQADAYVSAASPNANFGSALTLQSTGGGSPINTYLRFNTSAVADPILFAKLSLRITTDGNGGGNVSGVTATNWNEATISYNNAPAIDGGHLGSLAPCSRDGTVSSRLTNAVNADADHVLTFAVTQTGTSPSTYHSREDGQPPRLVLVTSVPLPFKGDMNCDGAVNLLDVNPFVLALVDPAGYAAMFPACDINRADMNDDSQPNGLDIGPFSALLSP